MEPNLNTPSDSSEVCFKQQQEAWTEFTTEEYCNFNPVVCDLRNRPDPRYLYFIIGDINERIKRPKNGLAPRFTSPLTIKESFTAFDPWLEHRPPTVIKIGSFGGWSVDFSLIDEPNRGLTSSRGIKIHRVESSASSPSD